MPKMTPTPDSASMAENIRVMFYNTEIQRDFTIWAGNPIDLTVQIAPITLQTLSIEWECSDPEILSVQRKNDYTLHVECHDNGNLPTACTLTLTCAGFQKELTVYCRPAS
jgi:hypothetical protein